MLHQALIRFESRCRLAQDAVARADSFAEVVRAADVVVPAELRGVKGSIGAYAVLKRQARQKVNLLADSKLEEIERLRVLTQRKEAVGRCRVQWQPLRGHFPDVIHHLEREAARLLNQPGLQRPDSIEG